MHGPKTLSKAEKKRIREARRYKTSSPKQPKTLPTPRQITAMKTAILKNMRP